MKRHLRTTCFLDILYIQNFYIHTIYMYILYVLVGKSGVKYEKQSAFCVETQHFPNSANTPNFPTTTLKAGQIYSNKTTFTINAIVC